MYFRCPACGEECASEGGKFIPDVISDLYCEDLLDICLKCGWEAGNSMARVWIVIANEKFTETGLLPLDRSLTELKKSSLFKDVDGNKMYLIDKFEAEVYDEARARYEKLISNPLRNPDVTERYEDKGWKFEEDYNSPMWKLRMAVAARRRSELCETYGFINCPGCGVEHTTKTLVCRNCNYRAKI